MSLKLVLGFLFFAILSCYVAFLNPQEVELHLTQTHSLKVPTVVLLLGTLVMGVVITAFFNGLHEIRGLPTRLCMAFRDNQQRKQQLKRETLFAEAENAVVSGRSKKALLLFQKVLSTNPDHIPSLSHLGDFMRAEGKHDQAIAMHGKANRLAPRNIKVLYSLAEDYAAENQRDKEIEILQQILARSPDSSLCLRKLRDAWLKAEDWEKAINIQKEALRLTPFPESEKEISRLCEIIHINAMHYYKRGDTDSARDELQRAIEEDKYSLPAYIALGDIFLKKQLRKEALKVWKTGYSNTKSAVCLQRIQSIAENDFVKLCEKELASSDAGSNLAVMLGILFLETGENEKAVRILEDTVDDSSLSHHILLVTARQAKNSNGLLPDASRSIFNKVRQFLLRYTCRSCLSSLKEWSSHCPSCKSWDSIVPSTI